jgi:hypothetical protein
MATTRLAAPAVIGNSKEKLSGIVRHRCVGRGHGGREQGWGQVRAEQGFAGDGEQRPLRFRSSPRLKPSVRLLQ